MLWKIFALFSRVALFSWGGGPASLALMQREVTAAGWTTPAEFADAVATGNALPGPIAPQVSAFVGYKLAGWPGAISAVAGTVVPATLLMLALVAGFFAIKDNPLMKAAIAGMRPFVVGLLAWTAYQMAVTIFKLDRQGLGTSLKTDWSKWLIALGTFLILTFTTISPIWLVLAAAVIGLIFYR